MNKSFWKNKRVFLTGHTGFKGAWLGLWLQEAGSIVKGYALPPNTKPNLFDSALVAEGMESEFGDIRDLTKLTDSVKSFAPDIVIHMAAQPLVRHSYEAPVETYSTNVMGTVNLLEAVRKVSSVRAVVNVTTDKCYENKEWVWGYRECEPMGGSDPYSSSKGCSELVTSSYRRSFFNSEDSPKIASGRAGNVIGGGDWSKDRLIPDILRSFESGESLIIRNPGATRPWQHVLEPLSGYLTLAERLTVEGTAYADAWNFGPEDHDVKPVSEVVDYMVARWGASLDLAYDEANQHHEANLLKLDISKAKGLLKWKPIWSLFTALDKVLEWQKAFLVGDDARLITLEQIRGFENDRENIRT